MQAVALETCYKQKHCVTIILYSYLSVCNYLGYIGYLNSAERVRNIYSILAINDSYFTNVIVYEILRLYIKLKPLLFF